MSDRPNILFVFSDQQRPDTMGCYGQRLPVTPNLDRLAAEGVRFDRAFTCQPVCGPARAALQTGKWATQTGCFHNDIALPDGERTMAHRLSGAGYAVGYVGKWHLASSGQAQNYKTRAVPPRLRGGYRDFWIASDVLEFTSHGYGGHLFDARGRHRAFPASRYRVDGVTDFALEGLRALGRGRRPFFLFVSYIEPHHQNDRNRYEGPRGSRRRFRDYAVPGDLEGTAGDWRANYPDYLGCCAALDRGFGRIRAELERTGQWENTVVIYTSDHGSHFRTRNSEYKRSCHDASIRIPMIARGPGFPAGRVESSLVSLLDLTPTVLRAGGVQPEGGMAGRPLQELSDGRARRWRDAVYVQISESQIGRAIRTERWTYAVRAPEEKPGSGWVRPDSAVYVEDCLYDMLSDPHQRRNLVADPALAGARRALRRKLKACMQAAGERPATIRPA